LGELDAPLGGEHDDLGLGHSDATFHAAHDGAGRARVGRSVRATGDRLELDAEQRIRQFLHADRRSRRNRVAEMLIPSGDVVAVVLHVDQEGRDVHNVRQRQANFAERRVEARTRPEPRAATDGRTFHVYPQGYQGERQQPAFNGLLAAFNLGASQSDWFNAFGPRVEPGDVIQVHAGLYKDTRFKYGSGIGTLFDGTYYLTASGTAERPIVIRAAGDGPVIFDGDGNGVLFDVTAGSHLYFEGLTFRNTEIAILAGRKRIIGSEGLTVKHSRFEDVGIGITTDWSGSKNFYIADNVFVGRQIPDHLMGWIGRTWQNFPDFPVPLRSNAAVKVYGSGHVIAHNEVAHFHDGIDHATYGNPDLGPDGKIIRIPGCLDALALLRNPMLDDKQRAEMAPVIRYPAPRTALDARPVWNARTFR